jgi:Zn-dependent peptidase ImmA (M78 family)
MVEKADIKKAKNEALALLKEFGYTSPPINPIEIANKLGVQVYFVDIPPQDDKVISGFYEPEENAIFINQQEVACRQTFTIAHELGHSQLHRAWAQSADYQVLYREQINNIQSKNPKEQEANAFAAHLLVPKFILDRYSSIASIQELATLFAVSPAVVENRMRIEY